MKIFYVKTEKHYIPIGLYDLNPEVFENSDTDYCLYVVKADTGLSVIDCVGKMDRLIQDYLKQPENILRVGMFQVDEEEHAKVVDLLHLIGYEKRGVKIGL